MTTASTVRRIALEIRAVSAAIGLLIRTVLVAFPLLTHFTERADITTNSTVVAIVFEAHTGPIAIDLLRRALTSPLHTLFVLRTGTATASTVVPISVGVHAAFLTGSVTGRTLRPTLPPHTDLIRPTGVTGTSTVVGIASKRERGERGRRTKLGK